MKISAKQGEFFTEQDIADISAAGDKIAAAMALAPGATGKLKITSRHASVSLTLPAGEGGNCADEKTQALIDNPNAFFTEQCEFRVDNRIVSWQGGLRVKYDRAGRTDDLILAFSGLAGWQDLFFTIGAAVTLAGKERFAGDCVLTVAGLEELLSKNGEDYAIYHILKRIL